MPMGPLGDYDFIQRGDVGIGAIMPLMRRQQAAAMDSSISGSTTSTARWRRSGTDGGQVLQEPQQIPGGEYSMSGIDPQGARFALVGPRKA